MSGKETRLEEARPKNNAAIIGISSNEPLGAKLPAREAAVQFVWEMVFIILRTPPPPSLPEASNIHTTEEKILGISKEFEHKFT